MQTVTVKLSDIVFRKDLYPRFNPDPKKIQDYSENTDVLPPIELDQHNILIDGYHRWKAHETIKAETIECIITEVSSEFELEKLAVRRNAFHGKQLSLEEKKAKAIRWWDMIPNEEIMQELSITERTYSRWTKSKRDSKDKKLKQDIFNMWLACYTQQEISDEVKIPQQTVSDEIAKFTETCQMAEIGIFRNFEPKIYTVWNFPKLTNKTKVFGSVPQEIIDNLLYYYTKPSDVVFDPFGGGGSTIDKCKERNRRYYVSDLSPIPARDDIRQWDITQGLPDDLPVPKFVFLDPPYWKQAKKKYSEKETDLGNVELNEFLDFIGNIVKNIKRKWGKKHTDAKLALIIGPSKDNGNVIDLPFLCHQRIAKYLKPINRIQVPYSTQIHGGNFVKIAKEKKELLYLSRDLMIYGI